MSEWKMSTENAITQNASELEKRYRKRRAWFPGLFMLASAVVITNEILSGSDELMFIIATELVISLLAWSFYRAAVERDVIASKFSVAAGVVDLVITHPSNGNGAWEWDQDDGENVLRWPKDDDDPDAEDGREV